MGVGNDSSAVSDEIISKEFVDQVDLHNDVDEIEHFTVEESHCVDVVATLVIIQKFDHFLVHGALSIRIGEICLKFRSEGLHLVIFEQFPQRVRSVEEQRLEKENETHPFTVVGIFQDLMGSNRRL